MPPNRVQRGVTPRVHHTRPLPAQHQRGDGPCAPPNAAHIPQHRIAPIALRTPVIVRSAHSSVSCMHAHFYL